MVIKILENQKVISLEPESVSWVRPLIMQIRYSGGSGNSSVPSQLESAIKHDT